MLPVRGTLRCLRAFLKAERDTPCHQRRLDLLLRGFVSQRAQFYPFDRYDAAWFLTDWEIENQLPRVNSTFVRQLLKNKLLFHLFFLRQNSVPRAAELIGLLDDGRWHSFTDAELDVSFHYMGGVFAKPIIGAGGRDVVCISAGDALPSAGTYVVETPIKQHPYAASVFPKAVNTIRIYVAQYADAGEPFVVGAAHRFGTERSAPVDNLKRGGITSAIDLRSGELSAARSLCGRLAHRHPDTRHVIEGLKVPWWTSVKSLALRLSGLSPGFRFVGWDICMTTEGPAVVEGNAEIPHPNLVQAHYPILMDPATRSFFEVCGVISAARARRLERMERPQSFLPGSSA